MTCDWFIHSVNGFIKTSNREGKGGFYIKASCSLSHFISFNFHLIQEEKLAFPCQYLECQGNYAQFFYLGLASTFIFKCYISLPVPDNQLQLFEQEAVIGGRRQLKRAKATTTAVISPAEQHKIIMWHWYLGCLKTCMCVFTSTNHILVTKRCFQVKIRDGANYM